VPPLAAVAAPAAQVVVLTRDRIIAVDPASSRLAMSRSSAPGEARKVVAGGPFVFLQRKQAVEVLDGRTLQRLHIAEWPDDVRDIAASGSLLLVAVGPDVHILRVGASGQTAALRAVHLPKPIDALAASGMRAYALDDFQVPLNMHRIDLTRPEAPRVETMPWVETNAHLRAQAVGDRWYVLVGYTTISERGQYVVMLPATAPLRELGHRTTARERRPLRPGAAAPYFVDDFRVFRGVFFGVAPADDHLWLVRRPLGPDTAETQRVADLGAVAGWPPVERRGAMELAGARLFAGASGALVAFELDPVRPPTRVLTVPMPSPVISIALEVSGR
jgi:hypothetical protein